MWCRTARRRPSWLGLAGFHSSSRHLQRLVAAEVAQIVSLQTPGMVQLPAQVQQAIDSAAAETNRKMVKQKGQELTQRLRQMSRTKHRGGLHPNLKGQQQQAGGMGVEAAPAYRRGAGAKRQSRRQLLQAISRAAALPVDGKVGGSKPDVAGQYWDEAQRGAAAAISDASEDRIARREGETLYDEAASLAYGATRMPACYAALRRVLSEVAARRPGWRPASVLDFGAGPGTATWAAQQVWAEAPLQVLAVEPSASMTWLGQRVWAQHQEAHQQHLARLAQHAEQREGAAAGADGAAAAAEEGDRDGGAEAQAQPQVTWQASWGGRQLSAERLGRAMEDASSPGALTAVLAALDSSGGSSSSGNWEDPQRQQLPLRQQLDEGGGDVAAPLSDGAAEEEEEIEEEQEEEEEEAAAPAPAPRVRWVSRLPPRSRPQGARQHDLVVAAFVLGEMRDDEQRRKAVDDLWQRTQGLLVLVEPGTPAGFAHVNAARSQILADPSPGSSSLLGSSGSSGVGEGAQQAAAAPSAAGAHVVAPCPHDGPCPLVGRRSWCHFVQRFERTGLQRQAKSVGGKAARVYQDERFSYVVLARGPRPQAVEQVALAGRLVPRAEDALQYRRLPEHLQPRSIGWLGPEEGPGAALLGDIEGERAAIDEDDEEEELDEATKQLILESILGNMDEEEEEEGAALAAQLREQLFDSGERPTRAGSSMVSTEQPSSRGLAAVEQQQQQQQQPAGTLEPPEEEQGGVGLPAEQPGGLGEEEEGEVDWAARDPEGLAATVSSSGVWSRVLRTPRKRSGHVVLDLCSAVQADGTPAPEGALLRQVVSKASSSRQLGGPEPYRLARRLRWGDLWPLPYQRPLKATVPPAAEAFQQQ